MSFCILNCPLTLETLGKSEIHIWRCIPYIYIYTLIYMSICSCNICKYVNSLFSLLVGLVYSIFWSWTCVPIKVWPLWSMMRKTPSLMLSGLWSTLVAQLQFGSTKKVSSQISKGWVFCWSVLYGIRSSSRVHLPKDLQRSLQDQYGKGKVLQEGIFEAWRDGQEIGTLYCT